MSEQMLKYGSRKFESMSALIEYANKASEKGWNLHSWQYIHSGWEYRAIFSAPWINQRELP